VGQRTCSVEDCERAHYARGWCQKHYAQWWRTGGMPQRDQQQLCAIEGCNRPHGARGWCTIHYDRWRRTGQFEPSSFEDRFWAKVDATGICWEWIGARNPAGYGKTWRTDRYVDAHRAAWELLVGPIGQGLNIDHLCRNRSCINPDHLEPVPQWMNVMRAAGSVAAVNATKTHCPAGHEYDGTNTSFEKKAHGLGRRCKACRRDQARMRHRARKIRRDGELNA